MSTVAKLWLVFVLFVALPVAFFVFQPGAIQARNIQQYSDTITDSAPNAPANHTFRFTVDTEASTRREY